MVFYLQDATSGDSSGPDKTLATVQVQATIATSARSGSITALPPVITLPAGQSAGRTTLEWRTTGVTRIQIRVNSATGAIMTGLAGPSGRATTGNWVTNGMTFYLQDAGDGNSAGATRTLASVRVTVSR